MSFLGSLVGAGATLANQQLAYENSKKLTAYTAKTNYKYAEKSARNSPTWNRAGLENAGYNPMLAVQNATAGANSSWTSNASAPMADITSGMSNATQALQAKAHLDNETKTAESTKKVNEANQIKSLSEGVSNILKMPYIDQREKAEIANVEKGTAKMQSEINNLDKTTEYIDKYYQLEKYMQNIVKRGQDLSFAGAKYVADKGYSGTVYNAKTQENIAKNHLPTGKSASFHNYAGGIADILSGAGSILNPFKGKFDHGYTVDEHTQFYDHNGKGYTKNTHTNYNRR